MRKFLIKIVVIISICGCLTAIGNNLFMANYGHYSYHMMNEMYNAKDNIDVVFLGSSHVYRSYNTKLADELLDCKTFNAGSSSQGMNTSYYLLKEICKYHDVKTVYLDTFFGVANLPENDAQVFVISDYMREGNNKFDLLYGNGGIETVINGYVTLRRNKTNLNIKKNIIYKNLAIDDYSTVTFEDEEYRGDGFVYSFIVADADLESTYSSYANKVDLRNTPPTSYLFYKSLMNIIDFCKTNSIELVLVNQPMPRKTTDYVVGYGNYVAYISKIASDNGIPYWNFDLSKKDLGLSMDDYKDGEHLNGKGADIYTNYFCDLVNRYKQGKCVLSDEFNKEY